MSGTRITSRGTDPALSPQMTEWQLKRASAPWERGSYARYLIRKAFTTKAGRRSTAAVMIFSAIFLFGAML